MDDKIPYHYCKKCRQQLAVCSWGIGICDACAVSPIQQARLKRLTGGGDIVKGAERCMRKARDIKNRIADMPTESERRQAKSQAELVTKEADIMRAARKRLRIARAEKKRGEGAFLPDGTFGPDDKGVNKQTGRRCRVRLHHFPEKAQGYQGDGNPHKTEISVGGF